MTQTIKLSNGDTLNFPDEMTDDQIHSAIQNEYKNGNPSENNAQQMAPFRSPDKASLFDQLKNNKESEPDNTIFGELGKKVSSIPRDFGAGLLSSLQSLTRLAPNITNNPEIKGMQLGTNILGDVDPYKEFGTENKSILTPGGLVQEAGEFSVPFPAISKAAKGLKSITQKGFDAIHPEKYAKQLADELSSGSSNLQQTSKDIAKTIKQKFADRISEPTEYYNFLDKQIGEGKIFEKPDPLITTALDKQKPLLNRIKDLNVGDLYKTFKENPNYKNANSLQSELGLMIGDIERGIKTNSATRHELSKVKSVRDQLKSSIKEYLDKKSSEDGFNYNKMYDKATDLYRENVAPYLSSPKLRELTRKGKTNVKGIEKIFSNPSDIENAITGETKVGAISKILNDLPQEIKNKILFKNAGGYVPGKGREFSEKLYKSLQGDFAHLGNEDLFEKLKNINSRIGNKGIAKKAGYASGLSAGSLELGDLLMKHGQRKSDSDYYR